MKWSLKTKIIFWFITIILISIIIYGSLIFSVYRTNLKGENYLKELRKHPEIDQALIDRIGELQKPGWRKPPPPLTILPFHLFMRIFYIITGGVLFIIILSASGGFVFLNRMLKRIDLITRNVKEIDAKKLHLRLNLKGTDAISNMANTFDDMLDKIENSLASQRQFIQNASHELNTPLTVIKTRIDSLKQRKQITGTDCRETLDLIDCEIMRLSAITQELLVLSNLEDSFNREGFTAVNVKTILERLLKLHNNQIDSKNLNLKTAFNGSFTVRGTKTYIEQLLFNLLNNAVKYSVYGGDLLINLDNDKQNRNLMITIANKTDALGTEDISHIFEKFYRSAKGEDRKGFGLGLSISKEIAERLGGSIKAEFNQKEETASFIVTLPLSAEK